MSQGNRKLLIRQCLQSSGPGRLQSQKIKKLNRQERQEESRYFLALLVLGVLGGSKLDFAGLLSSGRHWIRTSDLRGVSTAL